VSVASTTDGTPGTRLRTPAFEVHLENFSGPFDLLLSLIAKHQMDITEVALAAVTDEFIAHIRRADGGWDLGQASEFLVVAATLLDLKAARLLPSGQVEDAEDLALLEARDLLFARLLQYRAYKLVAAELGERLTTSGRRVPRAVSLDPHLAGLLPELVFALTPEQLAEIAARALSPRPGPPEVGLDHLHGSAVSVAEQAEVVVTRMRRSGVATFRDLVADAESTLVVVARFLALLELFRESAVTFEQASALGELTVRWTGSDSGAVQVSDEFDEADGAAAPDPQTQQVDGDEQA
jgi:segregation and condensation protein A